MVPRPGPRRSHSLSKPGLNLSGRGRMEVSFPIERGFIPRKVPRAPGDGINPRHHRAVKTKSEAHLVKIGGGTEAVLNYDLHAICAYVSSQRSPDPFVWGAVCTQLLASASKGGSTPSPMSVSPVAVDCATRNAGLSTDCSPILARNSMEKLLAACFGVSGTHAGRSKFTNNDRAERCGLYSRSPAIHQHGSNSVNACISKPRRERRSSTAAAELPAYTSLPRKR